FNLDPDPSLGFSALDTDLIFGYFAIFILLVCSALVSAAEVALFSLTTKDLESASQDDPAKASVISKLLLKPKKLLATILVANTFTSIGVIIIFFRVGSSIFSGIASEELKFAVEVVTITFLILLFGEVLPKIYANRNNVRFSKFIAKPMDFLYRLLSPLTVPMREISLYLHEKLGKQKTNFSVDQLSQALELTSS